MGDPSPAGGPSINARNLQGERGAAWGMAVRLTCHAWPPPEPIFGSLTGVGQVHTMGCAGGRTDILSSMLFEFFSPQHLEATSCSRVYLQGCGCVHAIEQHFELVHVCLMVSIDGGVHMVCSVVLYVLKTYSACIMHGLVAFRSVCVLGPQQLLLRCLCLCSSLRCLCVLLPCRRSSVLLFDVGCMVLDHVLTRFADPSDTFSFGAHGPSCRKQFSKLFSISVCVQFCVQFLNGRRPMLRPICLVSFSVIKNSFGN